MKLENGYLSDEELEQLILDIEQNELVTAPPELFEKIIRNIEEVQEISKEERQEELSQNKVKEFRRYCFRVVTSVAVAVIMVFTLPNFLKVQHLEMPITEIDIMSETIFSREEVLNKESILSKTFCKTNIFNKKEFYIFH